MGAAVVGLRFFPELEATALVSGVLAAIPEPRTAVGDGREIDCIKVLSTSLVDRQASRRNCVCGLTCTCGHAQFLQKKIIRDSKI